jgi:hypothetical protein
MVPVPVAVAFPQPDQLIPETVLVPSAVLLISAGSVSISAPEQGTAGSRQTVMTIAGAVVAEEAEVGGGGVVVAVPLGVVAVTVGVVRWVGVTLGLGVARAVGVCVNGVTTLGAECGCWLRA